MNKRASLYACLGLASFIGIAGCQPTAPTTPSGSAVTADHDHDHTGDAGHSHTGHSHVGLHAGTVADWGGGKYHVEFTVDHDKQQATVYVLDADVKLPVAIKSEKLLLSIKQPAFQMELTAQPLESEIDGSSSRFVGTHPSLGTVQEFAGIISGEVDGTPYAGAFAEEAHVGHDHK